MQGITSTPTPCVHISVAWFQKLHILTSNFVLSNSKWEHSPICQYCFKHTSQFSFLPLQFKGKERGRLAQLVEISQNKLSDKQRTLLRHHSPFADCEITLSLWPRCFNNVHNKTVIQSTPHISHWWISVLMHKLTWRRILDLFLSPWATSKEIQPSAIKKKDFMFQKQFTFSKGDHSWHTIAVKTHWVSGSLIPFLSLLWMRILRVIDHLIKSSPKESDPFSHAAQEFRRKPSPPPFFRRTTNTPAPSNIAKWLPFADKKAGNKMIK